jgi:signal transduction histidine kinase
LGVVDANLVQAIICDLRVGYAQVDSDLRVVARGGATELLGCEAPSPEGLSLLDLVPELVGMEPVITDVLSGTLPRLEVPWVNRTGPDGSDLLVRLVLLPTRDAKGQPAGLLHLVQDHTEAGVLRQQLSQSRNELRLAQEQLVQQNLELATANAELRRLDELKSTFVSVAAHELRTPLASILGYVETLTDGDLGPLSDGQREYLAIIQESAHRLSHITSSLLDVARIEAGRVDLVLQPTDLLALVRGVAAEYEPQVTARAQQLTLHHTPELPPALCDRTRTAQIVGNLLSNAIKYSPPKGHVEIAIERAQIDGFLQLSVTDDGIGIGPEDQDMLFRRFFRATSAAQTGASGAGLGLYITRSLVELHSGRIWLESEAGKGSTFYVALPIAE